MGNSNQQQTEVLCMKFTYKLIVVSVFSKLINLTLLLQLHT
jgi:hypothetical protein